MYIIAGVLRVNKFVLEFECGCFHCQENFYHAASNGMRTLRIYKDGLCIRITAQIYCREFSAISNAKADRSRDQECLVSLGTSVTHVSLLHQILQSSAGKGAPMEGQACHAQSIRVGLQSDTLMSNMLINMYAKCGLHNCARKVFDEMPDRSLVSWNTMIGSLARSGEEHEALSVFVCMQREENQFSEFTVSSVLSACAAKCLVSECKQLHAFAFKSMPERSDVTWSSMVAGPSSFDRREAALKKLTPCFKIWRTGTLFCGMP
ncbi:hypothetical protein ACLB2K_077461 [Fragaria x ananassa]